jgi:hypothetical protein
MLLLILGPKGTNMLQIDVCIQSEHKLPKMQTQQHWRAVDVHSKNVAVTTLQSLSPINATSTSVLNNSNQMCGEISYLHDYKSISNNPRFRLKHPGVPDGSDGSGRTLYPLTENQTWPVAQTTGRLAYLTCGGYYTMPLIGFLYFASRMWWRTRTTRTTCMFLSSQGL